MMANFRPKQPITGSVGEYYADTLENFLKRRPLKKMTRLDIIADEMSRITTEESDDAQNERLLQMRN